MSTHVADKAYAASGEAISVLHTMAVLQVYQAQLHSTQNLLDHNLQQYGCPVPSSTVKNIGVILDSNLYFENHISHVTKTAFFHLRNVAKLRNMLSVSDAK